MEQNSVIRFAYMLFLGLLVATFIGVGVAAFYKPPKMPGSDMVSPARVVPDAKVNPESATQSAEAVVQDTAYQKEWEAFSEKQKIYDRNVSAIVLGFAVALFVVSLLFFKKILIISDGLLMGSVFTLIYSIVRGFNSQDEIFRFFVVSIGLVIALILGYLKFVKSTK